MGDRPLRVFLPCTGVGVMNRGIETFARECFDGLREHASEIDLTLFKGRGATSRHERVLWSLPRTGRAAVLAGRLIRRTPYTAEQLSSFLPFVRRIRQERPDLIYYSDSNLGFQLYRWRRQIGVPYRLLFSNGGPLYGRIERTDVVQQVTPALMEQALDAGEDPARLLLVPYGIHVPHGPPNRPSEEDTRALRLRLGLPQDGRVLLSVGWIQAAHKRMDYTVREVASVPPERRPHLVLLGSMDAGSPEILALATELLGTDGFTARSVPYEEVAPYYQAADAFVLSSLQEGFGRVYLEALMYGLPTFAHDGPVMQYVLGDEGLFANLSRPGALAERLSAWTRPEWDEPEDAAAQRRNSVRDRFGWETLAPSYVSMFAWAAQSPIGAPPLATVARA